MTANPTFPNLLPALTYDAPLTLGDELGHPIGAAANGVERELVRDLRPPAVRPEDDVRPRMAMNSSPISLASQSAWFRTS